MDFPKLDGLTEDQQAVLMGALAVVHALAVRGDLNSMTAANEVAHLVRQAILGEADPKTALAEVIALESVYFAS